MISYAKWILIAFSMCMLVSFVDKDKPTKGLNLGDLAPNFELVDDNNHQFSLERLDLQGKYVLVNFWASYDADSRMKNVSLSNVLQSKNSNIEMISVSFDTYKSIFEETIKTDQIIASNNFVETRGQKSKLFNDYKLDNGFCNYLLNEKGIIIAKNISVKQLSNYIN